MLSNLYISPTLLASMYSLIACSETSSEKCTEGSYNHMAKFVRGKISDVR